MSIPLNPNQILELRDASGQIVGFFTPEKAWKDLLAERDQLREELEKVKEERDNFRISVEALMQKKITFTAEELEDLQKNGLSFEQVMEEIQPILEGKRNAG